MNKVNKFFRGFFERADNRASTKTVFVLAATTGLVCLLYAEYKTPSVFTSNFLMPIFVFLAFMAASLVIIMGGIMILTFLEMMTPQIQKRLTVLKTTIKETKETLAEAKALKQDLITIRNEINTLKNEVNHIHSTTPCLALQDFVKDIANNSEKTPSQELRDEVVQLKTQVSALHETVRGINEQRKKFFDVETDTKNNEETTKPIDKNNKFEPKD